MTIDEAKKKIRYSITVNKIYLKSIKNADETIDQIFNDHEEELKVKDEKIQQLDDAYASVVSDFESAVMEIESLKTIINTSIEEIEYAIIKPQYAEVYLNNAIRFLKEQQ